MPLHSTAVSRPLDRAENQGLDPDTNICTPVLLKGHYRRQRLAAARDGIWGTENGTCGRFTLSRIQEGEHAIMPVLCGTWGCKLCGPMKAAWLKRELQLAQVRCHLDHFWTLTVQTGSCTPRASSLLITGWWRLLRQRMNTLHGRFSFVWILEHTKNGYAHLHLLASCPATRKELKAAWSAISNGSYIVKVLPVTSGQAADYLAKYCSQQARDRTLPGMEHMRGRRFFSKSQDVQFAPFMTPGEHVELLNEGTGELHQVSTWELSAAAYWPERNRLAREHGPAVLERVQGVPMAVFPANLRPSVPRQEPPRLTAPP